MIEIATYEYPVIYVYRIDDEKHKGLMKVGMTSIKAESADLLEANCEALRTKAKARINEQTCTAAVDYDLLYTELAFFAENDKQYTFTDYDVRDVLANSGYSNAGLTNNNGAVANEWVKVDDIEIVKKAITAVKERRSSLDPNDFKKPEASPHIVIKFREEQSKAIDDTLARFAVGNKMLWNAKMRFGKTLCALEVIKRKQYRRTLIITHRPSVRSGWFEDFNLLDFDDDYFFGHKKVTMPKPSPEDSEEQKKINELIATKVKKFDVLEKNAESGNMRYIYFASIQDLRESWDKKTRQYKKNEEIFKADWDLLIVDEAHEGTKTELGQSVIAELQKHQKMRTLYLSGTPYNILGNFNSEEIYSWTYEMEQDAKQRWYSEHPDEPNPYEDLPRLELHTYNIDKVFDYERDEEYDFFNFAEFFRVDKETSTFVHEKEVKDFLDLMCKDSKDSNYPYSTEEYRFSLSHTLWVLPGVAEAAALSKLIKEHDTLKQYYVINVAGEGDDDQDNSDSVKNVKDHIAAHEKTITLTCGRLTTGVSVPEWSAVFMLCGGAKISAAFYLQTIFRAQTPTKRNVVPKKKVCYAFDFAPDRTIEVINEYVDQQHKASRQQPPGDRETYVTNTLHFLAIIAHDGSQEKPYDTISFMEAVGEAYKEHIKRKGFRDRRLFVDLGRLTDEQYRIIGEIGLKMSKSGHTFGAGNGGSDGIVDLTHTGLDNSKPPKGNKTEGHKTNNTKNPNPKPPKHVDKSKAAFMVLGDIYIRLPMLIFGCDFKDKKITLKRILDMVDDASWAIFMPKGVGKAEMRKLIDLGVLNEERFGAAANDIPEEIKAADSLPITERVKAIAGMIARFHFPDKETVLTPWRVVNMHLSDTIGGYDFYDAEHKNVLSEPRLVWHEGVTDNIFKADARVLEINSKSGLYPLYMAYSLYRKRITLSQTDMFAPRVDTDEGKLYVWDQVLSENLYVLCMSEMAAKITHRVLAGYRDVKTNTLPYLKGKDLVADIKNNKELPKVVARIKGKNNFWGNNTTDMKFDAIVGNPPYQINDGSGASDDAANPIYQEFVRISKALQPAYMSLIMPSKWMIGGKTVLKKFKVEMMNDIHLSNIFDFENDREIFPSSHNDGGICYILWDGKYNQNGYVHLRYKDSNGYIDESFRPLKTPNVDIVVRDSRINPIVLKILGGNQSLSTIISNTKPFGVRKDLFNKPERYPNANTSSLFFDGSVKIYGVKGIKGAAKRQEAYVNKAIISKNIDLVNKWKLFFTTSYSTNAVIAPEDILSEPGSVCTETFIVIGPFGSKQEMVNCHNYLHTTLVRALLYFGHGTMQVTASVFQFVPLQDFTSSSDIDWNQSVPDIDKQLYKKYQLSDDEIAFIEKMIKPMD